jgi:hypothetical protein
MRNPAKEQAPHLEEEKAHFLFLEVPADDAGVVAAAPPAASAVRAMWKKQGDKERRTGRRRRAPKAERCYGENGSGAGA